MSMLFDKIESFSLKMMFNIKQIEREFNAMLYLKKINEKLSQSI